MLAHVKCKIDNVIKFRIVRKKQKTKKNKIWRINVVWLQGRELLDKRYMSKRNFN